MNKRASISTLQLWFLRIPPKKGGIQLGEVMGCCHLAKGLRSSDEVTCVWRKHSSWDWHQLVIGEVRELFIAVSIPAADFGGITWNSRLYKNYKVWQDFEALSRQRHLSSRQGCPGHLKALSAAPCIIINLVTLVLQWPNINQTKRCHDGSTDGACVDNPFHGRWLHAHDKISKHSGNTCGTLLSHSANLQSLGVTASLWAPPVNSSELGITQKPSKIIPKPK